MSTADRRRRTQEATRSSILEAARRIARHDGAAAVTLRRLAGEVDYSPAALYRYFPDRAAILGAVAAADHDALVQELHTLADVPDPLERIRRLVRAYVEFGLQNLDRYREMFGMPGDFGADARLPVSAPPSLDQSYTVLRRAVAQGVMALRFRPEIADVDMLTQLIWGGVHGLLALHAARPRESDIPWRPARQSAALMTEALLRGLARARPA
ncbi:MAG: TetR/AcrR family transcriptional regulator [Gemmatimonadaceae bacterium]